MVHKHLSSFGIAVFLFSITILATEFVTQQVVQHWIKPGVLETVSEKTISPDLLEGALLQNIVLQSPGFVPIYGSSEFGHGGNYNPTKLFAGKPTGWTPFLFGHAGSEDIIQALYASAQDLQGKKIALSLSAQWFGANGIAQNTFGANFSALQAYNMLSNPKLTISTKKELAQRLLRFDEVNKDYPILAELLKNYGQDSFQSRVKEAAYWPLGKIELAGLELQDMYKTVKALQKLPPKDIAKNASSFQSKKLPSWSILEAKANAEVAKNESNNPYGVANQYFQQNQAKLNTLQGSSLKASFYPSPEYKDLNLLMQVLKEEGAKPIFMIQPVNGRWYDMTGFPQAQRQKYYDQIRQLCRQNGFALADMSSHEYDPNFMDDPSHPSAKGWAYFDEALNKFVTSTQ